jgi:xylan 1,4-beta-xylosidase
VVQLFTIDGVRLMFNGGRRRFGRQAEAPVPAAVPSGKPVVTAYQYKLEVSMDGTNYTLALDQTGNDIQRNTIFEEIPPVKCRFVRLTLTNWPRETPLGILEFTVFGKPSGFLPAAQPIPVTK